MIEWTDKRTNTRAALDFVCCWSESWRKPATRYELAHAKARRNPGAWLPSGKIYMHSRSRSKQTFDDIVCQYFDVNPRFSTIIDFG